MRACSTEDTVTTLFDTGASLGIACLRCQRRTTFTGRQIVGHEASCRFVRRLPMICTGCGSARFDWFVLEQEDDTAAFLS